MNTGFLGPAVATVLTVYGIETENRVALIINFIKLQQYLPFTVLKLSFLPLGLTNKHMLQQYLPFTVFNRI